MHCLANNNMLNMQPMHMQSAELVSVLPQCTTNRETWRSWLFLQIRVDWNRREFSTFSPVCAKAWSFWNACPRTPWRTCESSSRFGVVKWKCTWKAPPPNISRNDRCLPQPITWQKRLYFLRSQRIRNDKTLKNTNFNLSANRRGRAPTYGSHIFEAEIMC